MNELGESFTFELRPDRATAIENAGVHKKGRNVEIFKADSIEQDKGLAGAEFILQNVDPLKPDESYQGKTDDKGKLLFEDVPIGRYSLIETKAPTGYVKSESPIIIDVTKASPVELTKVLNTQIKGSIQIKKTDQASQALSGVHFQLLKDNKVIDEQDTNGSGIINFSNVPYGTYVLKETKTIDGYELDTQTRQVSITSQGQQVVENWVNTKVEATIELTKKDQDGKPLAGAVFVLKKDNQEVARTTSNAQGLVRFTKVTTGNYVVEELTAPEGYVGSTDTQSISVTQNKTYTLNDVVNERIHGRIVLKKVGEDGQGLNGAVFGLYQNDKLVAQAISNEQGEVAFEQVDYGQYVVKEITAPQGYVSSTQTQTATINTMNQEVDLGNVENTLIRGTVQLTKVDADSGQTLSGVHFGLYQGDELKYEAISDQEGLVQFKNVIYGNYELKEITPLPSHLGLDQTYPIQIHENGQVIDLGKVENQIKKGIVQLTKVDGKSGQSLSGVHFGLYQDDELKYEAVSDQEGLVQFDAVNYGSYQLKEISTIEGYVLLDEQQEVEINEEGQLIDLGKIENQPIQGTIQFKKVNEAGQGLEGAVFVLKQDGQEKYRVSSNEDGMVIFKQVLYGKYDLEELSSPKGYIKSNEVRQVRIEKDKETVKLRDYVNKSAKTVHTGVSTGWYGWSAILALGIYLVLKKKSQVIH